CAPDDDLRHRRRGGPVAEPRDRGDRRALHALDVRSGRRSGTDGQNSGAIDWGAGAHFPTTQQPPPGPPPSTCPPPQTPRTSPPDPSPAAAPCLSTAQSAP